jgi:transglutaminase-like putative cysteine protease
VSGARTSLTTVVSMAAVAAATTWVALMSWRGFTEQSGRFLGPLLMLAIVVAATGALARWWRAPGPVVVLAQLAASGVVFSMIITGSPLPIGAAWGRMIGAFTDAVDTANRFAPPVPTGEPGVHPLLIAGGLGCILLVDLLACTVRRVPLAGLPLLTVYSVPVSMLGSGLTWWIFALTAAGFLLMLFLHESEQVSRWGRALGEEADSADPAGFGVRTGAVRASAGAIGGIVTALAIFVPLLIPTLSFQVFNFGNGPGGDGDINIKNPMVDLRRDLRRGEDIPMLTVTTDDPSPSYLRIGVLNRFSSNEWSSGDRDVPSSNRASGELPPLEGVGTTVTREEFEYSVVAASEFRSTWLPTQSQISRIDAPGDWRFDEATMDFLASDDDLDTSGLTWDFTSVRLSLDADALARSRPSGTAVGKQFTELPPGISSIVRNLALEVTRNAPTRFEKAVALQNWFRETGGFTYDDSVHIGNGADDLVAFLQDDEEGRTGYCEQFAAAMAVMARELSIPSRVAVGFLVPDKTGPSTYVYSAHDMHAWPELFFAGAGWVRFEPTPSDRAGSVPGYTTDPVTQPNPDDEPSASGTEAIDVPGRDTPGATPSDGSQDEDNAAGANSGGVPWSLVVSVLLALALVAAAVVGPRIIRARRRERRLDGGPEDVWLELRDTVVDLGMVWPRDRSPRQTREVLVRYFGAPVDEFTPVLPRRGPVTNPDAVVGVDSVVQALERRRYAREDSSSSGTWRAEVQTCIEALYGGAPRRARQRATWLPRSVFVRGRPVRTAPDEDEHVAEQSSGRVVDHVG